MLLHYILSYIFPLTHILIYNRRTSYSINFYPVSIEWQLADGDNCTNHQRETFDEFAGKKRQVDAKGQRRKLQYQVASFGRQDVTLVKEKKLIENDVQLLCAKKCVEEKNTR